MIALPRRALLRAGLAAPLLLRPVSGRAQGGYPSRPIRLIIPFSAGGPTDVLARILAAEIQATKGWSIVIENLSSGGGTVGTATATRAAPDGYTLFFGSGGTNGIQAALYPNLGYDVAADFTPLALACTTANIFVAHPGFPADDIAGLLRQAKSSPVSYGTAGIGTTTHMSAELLKMMTGANLVHIPYRGGGPSMNDLLAGHIPLMVDATTTSVPHIKAGRIKALAVTTRARDESLPEVPTVGETVQGYEATAWFGLFGPKNLPPDMVLALNGVLNDALRSETVARRYRELGATPGQETPEAFGRYVAGELTKWRAVVAATGVKPE
ncbi:Bug family tripartite tricarboxylate transporter substrate binding protein [Pararoseomonas indoligenes]|uniref:Tripartite tricarboxylate transporter substrate binding protein n=1 Tax=Roseomonas indoligenes TaxID=2820811 RepID=A0A940S4B3_9PROT|nr:tripartite tricarboxylate transporter substrate binding protein [Pararoseomonas indoligenes]MBP0491804.1 tripartite tricarboxylate transporter substrate binding protein [Pararoseomonas indoligenes]